MNNVKNYFIILLTVVLLFSAAGCTNTKASDLSAEAYLVIFQEFYPPDKISISSGGEFYVAVDLSEVLYSETDVIKEKIEEYIFGSRIKLLWDDMDGLIESGYITTDNGNPLYFENGVFFSYKDISVTETKLQTNASQWYGNLGGDGATYTVKKKANTWEITSVTNRFVS